MAKDKTTTITAPIQADAQKQAPKQTPQRAQRVIYTTEEKDAFKRKLLAEARVETEEMMSGFIKKALFVELDSLKNYITVKNSTRDLGDRLNNARALAPITQEAIDIMSTITIIDSVLMDGEDKVLRAIRSRSETVNDLIAAHHQFQDSLKDIRGMLMPLVDAACENGLVRDRDIMQDYNARKAVQKQMVNFGIDPKAANARELFEKAKEEQRIEELAKKEAEQKEKERLKLERETEQKAKEAANKTLMTALGIDANAKDSRDELRRVKLEMKGFEIDPASKDAVKQLMKKREETQASA